MSVMILNAIAQVSSVQYREESWRCSQKRYASEELKPVTKNGVDAMSGVHDR